MAASTRRADLDGLRGLAVLLVVGFHAELPLLRGAFAAVDVFFVLSGYFLATTMARRLATGEALAPFELVTRRIGRLLPVLAVVLLGTLASTLLYAPIDRAAAARHIIPVSFFAGNLAFAAAGVNYFRAGENPLLHTWTLGVELQLAVVAPLLFLALARWGERIAGTKDGADRRWIVMRTVMLGFGVAGVLSFTLSVLLNDAAPMWAYFGPHTRLWSFAAGAMMAFVTGGGQSAVGGSSTRLAIVQAAGLALLLLPVLFYEGTVEYPGLLALAPVGGTLCLIAGGDASSSSPIGRVFASRPLVLLGAVSFAWYLWHWPLMVLGGELLPGLGISGKLALGFAGLGAAVLTHRLLERPGPTALITGAMERAPLAAAIGSSAMNALLAASAAWQTDRFVATSVHQRFVDARADDIGHRCWGRSREDDPRDGCAFGDVSSATTIALIGDSHASHWLGGLDAAGKAHGWRIESHVMGACPAADLRGLLRGPATRLYRECAEFQEMTMRRLAAERPRAVLLSNADNYMKERAGLLYVPGLDPSAWSEGLRRTYARLDSMGIEVIVMRALPWVPFDVPSCLSRRAARLPFATDCTFAPERGFMATGRRAQDEAARGLPVRFVDLNDLVCGAGPARCSTSRDGLILYADDNHITLSFSASLAQALGARIAEALEPR